MFLKLFIIFLLPFTVSAQITTGGVNGTVKSSDGDVLTGATVKLVHEPTGSSYKVRSGKGGLFDIGNVSPGGPYSIEVLLPGYSVVKRRNLFIQLGDPATIDLIVAPKEIYLGNITVNAGQRSRTAMETFIDADRIAATPAVGRNLHDYLKTVPQAKLIRGNEGAVTIAGQNNRYNAFYIDGAVSNDVFGLSASGTNGGQAGISPVSIEAVNQFQVSVSPFDASMGNFTGAGINAVTRSGTNKTEGAVYYFFSNAALAGKTTGETDGFFMKNFGGRLQGALVQNKFFYFINIDLQREEHPQTFDFANYKGNIKTPATLAILANTLRANYHYDPGSFLNNPETIHAARMLLRLDWNAASRHKLSFSYRHTDGAKLNTNSSMPELLHFSRDGYFLSSRTRSGSFEIKSIVGSNSTNQLLLTYTQVNDERAPIGGPFPKVRINDGNGSFIFGTDASSTLNHLTQRNLTLLNKYTHSFNRHRISMGIDGEYNSIYNAFIQNSYGYYIYGSLADFLTNDGPSYYQSGYSLPGNNRDENLSAARFRTVKASFFMNDRFKISQSVTLNFGIRFDRYFFLTKAPVDEHFNQDVLPQLGVYWNLQNAYTGARMNVPVAVSPRLGFVLHGPGKRITIHGGAGIFAGRIPLAWPGNAYLNNGTGIGGYVAASQQLNRIRFRPDPYRPWKPAELGVTDNRIPINLTVSKIAMPKILRSLLGLDWHIEEWVLSVAGLFTNNLTEIAYKNINLLPPTAHASGPDNRNVYTLLNNGKIPLLPDGSNPYDHVVLLENYAGKKGHAGSYTFSVKKKTAGDASIEMSYNFCNAFAVNDGTSSVSMSQWRFMETVNGRNDIMLSRSDFSSGHRIIVLLSKQLRSSRKKMINTISIAYTGESGQPFSYVYGLSSMVRDDGTLGGNDLIYIPTRSGLAAMNFLPYATETAVFTPEQQKEALEKYISGNTYLNRHRGEYSERNAGRTPFTHIIDLKIKWEWKVRVRGSPYRFQLTLDVFNAGNLVNRDWGLRYQQQNDNFQVIRFTGYTSESDLVPKYQFDPGILKSSSFSVNDNFNPAYASRWMAQMGIKIIF